MRTREATVRFAPLKRHHQGAGTNIDRQAHRPMHTGLESFCKAQQGCLLHENDRQADRSSGTDLGMTNLMEQGQCGLACGNIRLLKCCRGSIVCHAFSLDAGGCHTNVIQSPTWGQCGPDAERWTRALPGSKTEASVRKADREHRNAACKE